MVAVLLVSAVALRLATLYPWSEGSPMSSDSAAQDRWQFDFAAIEARFAKRLFGAELVVDRELARDLEHACNVLGTSGSDDSAARAAFLFAKSFPRHGEELAEVFSAMCRYRKAVEHLRNTNPGNSLIEAVTLFEQSQALQREYFGEVAARELFDRQNSVTSYLLTRRVRDLDSGLSAAERDGALARLGVTEP